jgi:oligosaccharyltransferase complex subunit gamma
MLLTWLVPSILGLAASTVVSAAESSHSQLVKLASTNANGVIQLDSRTFDLVTSPRRNWTATIHLTALDPRRRCGPCKYAS